jgi:aspartate carbamoyltransferase catalytic subunit
MGSRRHLLSVNDLSNDEIFSLCKKAVSNPPSNERYVTGAKAVGLVFMEPSTRTRVSFERAAQRLGRPTILLEATGTSFEKGETLEDTLLNLAALEVGAFVVRFPAGHSAESLRNFTEASIINAGDGVQEHPTQALLDLCTLLQAHGNDFSKLKGLRLGIMGDLRRSRVASSWAKLAPRLGIELVLLSPESWKPDWAGGLEWSSDRQKTLPTLNALMALRVQKERMDAINEREMDDFIKHFRIAGKDLGPKQWLMHPGPVNWGVELDLELRHDPRSLILRQVACGLALRSVVLDFLDPLGE